MPHRHGQGCACTGQLDTPLCKHAGHRSHHIVTSSAQVALFDTPKVAPVISCSASPCSTHAFEPSSCRLTHASELLQCQSGWWLLAQPAAGCSLLGPARSSAVASEAARSALACTQPSAVTGSATHAFPVLGAEGNTCSCAATADMVDNVGHPAATHSCLLSLSHSQVRALACSTQYVSDMCA